MLVRFERFPVSRNSDLFGIDRGINEIFEVLEGRQVLPSGPAAYPAVDVTEEKDSKVLTLEVPGVSKGDLKITMADGMLTVSGERKPRALPEDSRWIRNEVGTGSFSRSFELGHRVNGKDIAAELKDGMLRIVIPKAEEARPREIQVR
jgi:HSP20 family protein